MLAMVIACGVAAAAELKDIVVVAAADSAADSVGGVADGDGD